MSKTEQKPEERKTLFINMFGASGSGKSTAAYGLAYFMKLKGYSVEYVEEEAKILTLKKDFKTLANQSIVFGEQYKALYEKYGTVDVIICDSPLLLSCIYGDIETREHLCPLAFHEFNKYNNLNFLLHRENFEYITEGRNQTAEEAEEIHQQIRLLLDINAVQYHKYEYPLDANILTIFDLVNEKLEEIKAQVHTNDK